MRRYSRKVMILANALVALLIAAISAVIVANNADSRLYAVDRSDVAAATALPTSTPAHGPPNELPWFDAQGQPIFENMPRCFGIYNHAAGDSYRDSDGSITCVPREQLYGDQKLGCYNTMHKDGTIKVDAAGEPICVRAELLPPRLR